MRTQTRDIYSSLLSYYAAITRVRLKKVAVAAGLIAGKSIAQPTTETRSQPEEELHRLMGKKMLFVIGLHRSGTTAMARELSKHSEMVAFENTGVPKDEGQFLQTVFPSDHVLGGPGRFGFNPRSHRTEVDVRNLDEDRLNLLRQWGRFWNGEGLVLLEKSPSNMLRTRFLARLFPNAHFLLVRRHPVPVSLATQRWTGQKLARLFEHYFHCDEVWKRDRGLLEVPVMEVRYEDMVCQSREVMSSIFEWLGAEQQSSLVAEIRGGKSARYFELWNKLPFAPRLLTRRFRGQAASMGYSLAPSMRDGEECFR